MRRSIKRRRAVSGRGKNIEKEEKEKKKKGKTRLDSVLQRNYIFFTAGYRVLVRRYEWKTQNKSCNQTNCQQSFWHACMQGGIKKKKECVTFSVYHSVKLRQEARWERNPGIWSDLSSRQLLWHIHLGGFGDRSVARGTERWMDLIYHKPEMIRQHWMAPVSLTASFVRHFVKLGLLSQLRASPGPPIDGPCYAAEGFCITSV